jgi:cytochrome c553
MIQLIAALALAAVAAVPAAAQTVDERLPTCLACHGENGQSQTPDVPSLGGQQAFYVTVQLLMFRDHMRLAEPMNDMANGLGDDDLQKLADMISKLPVPQPPAGARDDARIERARALANQDHCNSCHNLDYSGRDNAPRVADQREDYLVKTLRAYKDNSRHGYDGTMAEVLASVSDEQIADLAYYLARVR